MNGKASADRLRIAVVIESFDPAGGGNERSTAQILEELVRRGHDVTLITGGCAASHRPAGMRTKAMSTQRSSSVFRLRAFSRWARRELAEGAFDTSLSMTTAVPARVVQPRGGTVRETLNRNVARQPTAFRRRAKACVHAVEPKLRLLLRLERQTLVDPQVKWIAALSAYVRDQLTSHYGWDAERVLVIPNAAVGSVIDTPSRQASREATRTRHAIPGDAFTLLMAAHNPALKGYATLLDALVLLKSRQITPQVLLAGGFGPRERAAAASRGLAQQLRFLGVIGDTGPLYAAADVTVLPSWYDPSSKVVIESLMAETPAISTIYNGASEHLEPRTGPPRGMVIRDPGSVPELAAAIERLADTGFREACSAACAGLSDRLSMTRHVDRLEQVLAQVAFPPGPA